MPKAKTLSADLRTQKAKNGRQSLRDIKPSNSAKKAFTVHQLSADEAPEVEPLHEDRAVLQGPGIEVTKIGNSDYDEVSESLPVHMSSTQSSLEEEEEEDFDQMDARFSSMEDMAPKEIIKVKFGQFVKLVAHHDFQEVMNAHQDDEIIMSSNLLTELAGAHDKREERKIPLVFLVGIAIGVVLAYIFFFAIIMFKRLAYKRILLKISGEVLAGKDQAGIDFKLLKNLCSEIADVKKHGAEIAIVVGGGNFWRYRDFKNSGIDRVHSDYMGMLATVMNAMAMHDFFEKIGVESRTVSAINMPVVTDTYLRDKALAHLQKGRIIICAGGTGSPFFTTDSTAALRALELHCDVLLKATNVDCVYDKDPDRFKDAKSFAHLSYQEVFKKGLEVMDLSAIDLCAQSKLPIMVFNLKKKGNILKAVTGQKVGTLIENS